MHESLHFIFLNGPIASGKDTQAELLLGIYPDALRLSPGEIYREARTPADQWGQFHEKVSPFIGHVDSGGYLPDSVMLDIIKSIIDNEIASKKTRFVFTGFPRTINQLNFTDDYLISLEDDDKAVQRDFLYLHVSDDISRQRIAKRREEAVHQGIVFREDDDPTVIEKRLKVYKELTLPMLERLSADGRLTIINAEDSVEEVHEEVKQALGLYPPLYEGSSTNRIDRK